MFGASPPNCREDSFRIGQRQHQIHGATGTSQRETVQFPKAPRHHGSTRYVPPLRSQGLVADPALRTGHADAVAANVPAANRARVTGRLGCRSSWRHDEGWQRVTWRAAVNHENRHKGLLALHDRDDAARASRRSHATASAYPVPPARGDASGQRRRARLSATSPRRRPREAVVSEVVYEQVEFVRPAATKRDGRGQLRARFRGSRRSERLHHDCRAVVRSALSGRLSQPGKLKSALVFPTPLLPSWVRYLPFDSITWPQRPPRRATIRLSVQAVTAAEPGGDQPGSGCSKYDIEQTYTSDKEALASARINMCDQIPQGPELQAILRHHV